MMLKNIHTRAPLLTGQRPASNTGTLLILGSTGSIGTQTLQLLAQVPHGYSIDTLVAGNNAALLVQQAIMHKPKRVVLANAAHYTAVKQQLQPLGIEVMAGHTAVLEAASIPHDRAMAAISGRAGVEPTLAALQHSAVVALANKETLVYAGERIAQQRDKYSALILPVDSEHAALYALYNFAAPAQHQHLIITASGGPLLHTPLAELAQVTPEQACAHPKWTMGKKISVDSALMINKVLEVIEAHMLFGHHPSTYQVVVHPQAMVHALIRGVDGSVRAHFSPPSMRVPIAACLAAPDEWPNIANTANTALHDLTFIEPDPQRFEVLQLLPTLLTCAADARMAFADAAEAAVMRFLNNECRLTDIVPAARQALERAL